MNKEAFIAGLPEGHVILGEFCHLDDEYVVYKLNVYNPNIYVATGRMEWQTGWKYDHDSGHLAQVSYLGEEERAKILATIKYQK